VAGEPATGDGGGFAGDSLTAGAGAAPAGDPLTVGPRSGAGGGTNAAGDSVGAGCGEAAGAASVTAGRGAAVAGASVALGVGAAAGDVLPSAGADEVCAAPPLVAEGCAAGVAFCEAQLCGEAASEAPGRSSLTRPRTSEGMRSLFAV